MSEAFSENDELRLVLIGRTGSGKSASANTILGRHHFLSKVSTSSVTQVCEQGSAELPEEEQDEVSGRWKKVLVVDVPGFGDTRSDPDHVNTEIRRCVTLSAPGPHIFLLVIQLGRYTEDEDRAAREMLQILGESALQSHTVLVFTHGDDLEESGDDIQEFLGQGAPEALRSLVDDCGGRYHVLNNKKPENRNQVKELLRKVERMVEENGGQCYTSALFQEAEQIMDRGRSSRLEASCREAAPLPNFVERVKEIAAAGATGFVVGVCYGASAPLAFSVHGWPSLEAGVNIGSVTEKMFQGNTVAAVVGVAAGIGVHKMRSIKVSNNSIIKQGFQLL